MFLCVIINDDNDVLLTKMTQNIFIFDVIIIVDAD